MGQTLHQSSVVTIFYFTGVALYAFYQQHANPLESGAVRSADQILPYFVRSELPVGIARVVSGGPELGQHVGRLRRLERDGRPVTLTDIPRIPGTLAIGRPDHKAEGTRSTIARTAAGCWKPGIRRPRQRRPTGSVPGGNAARRTRRWIKAACGAIARWFRFWNRVVT